MSRLEEAFLGLVGVGEGALHVAEQLALQQGVGQGAAVDRHEGAVFSGGEGVDGPRHQLLAGATLSGDEDGGAGGGDGAHHVEERDHGRGDADDLLQAVAAAQLLLEPQVLLAELLALQGVADHDLELVDVEGLQQVIVGSQLEGGHRGLGAPEGGDDDDHGLRGGRLDVAEDLDAVSVRELDVRDHEVHGALAQHRRRHRPALRGQDLEALLLEHDREQLPHGLLVVHDQDPLHAWVGVGTEAMGRWTSTSVPWEGALRTVMSPPCSRTMR